MRTFRSARIGRQWANPNPESEQIAGSQMLALAALGVAVFVGAMFYLLIVMKQLTHWFQTLSMSKVDAARAITDGRGFYTRSLVDTISFSKNESGLPYTTGDEAQRGRKDQTGCRQNDRR